jgi:RNA ligase (TIGR02306 family)
VKDAVIIKRSVKMMSRKLASVQVVKAIKPIEEADRIEVIQILNWDCVARKGEYQIGDKVVYFEIDSLLPDIPAFEFLKGSSWSQKLNKYKISTHKFRNQISQGLVIPIKDLPDLYIQISGAGVWPHDLLTLEEGTDLTELLKIEKYEPPVSNGPLGETIQHEWYVPKTDEERVQVCAENVLPKYIESEQKDWYASIKLDGTSCTAGLFDDAFLIGGRNQWYKDENMYTSTVKKYVDIEKYLRDYQKLTGKYIVFQGELCGPGIQGNKLGLKEKEWFIFNVFESNTGKMDSYKKLNFLHFLNMCDDFSLKTVPIIPIDEKFDFKATTNIDEMVSNLLKYVDNIKYKKYFEDASPNQIAEGVVFRLNDMSNSFKVISNKFLLKGGE